MSSASSHPLIPAERVSGAQVFAADGEKVGHIEDVAIDKVAGTVAYAILSTGGFLGLIGERFQPLPWPMLDYDEKRRGYVVPMTAEQIRSAPAIDPAQLSGWDDSRSRQSIFEYYAPFGVVPYW